VIMYLRSSPTTSTNKPASI